MLRWLVSAGLGLAAAGAGAFFVFTVPRPLQALQMPEHEVDLVNGESMFWAGGCASCHAAPGSEDEERLRLTGGRELRTPFGTFRAPNISPDPASGIGHWTTLDFVNAMAKGISPERRHYYPSFPYPYYQHMQLEDLVDLKAFIDTLPPVSGESGEHDLNFPFSIRRGVGLWKLFYLDRETDEPASERSASVQRGQYLVQGPGHCGACHTPRDAFGGEITDRFLAGAESLEISDDSGKGNAEWVPNITPHADGIGGWSENDIAYSLELGFDPDFDSFGGAMVEVQENMARLPTTDREAIAAYLKTIPAVASERR